MTQPDIIIMLFVVDAFYYYPSSSSPLTLSQILELAFKKPRALDATDSSSSASSSKDGVSSKPRSWKDVQT